MKNPKSKNTDINLPDLAENTPVTIIVDNKEVQGVFSHWTKLNEAYIKDLGGKAYWRKPGKFNFSVEAATNVQENGLSVLPKMEVDRVLFNQELIRNRFDINKRFEFLSVLTRMIIKTQQVSLIVTGDGGLGKTFTVLQEFEKAKLIPYGIPVVSDEEVEEKEISQDEDTPYDYVVIKGFSTPKGLYQTLYHHRNKRIIFDDCDSVLMNDIAVNLLKGALDSYDKRIISWISTIPLEDLPNQFEFMGTVIFISNKKRSQIPQALISRATSIDVSMTTDEKIARMQNTLSKIKPKLDMAVKQECLDLLAKHKDVCADLNFRTLLKVISIKTSGEKNWEELAEYMVLS